MYTSWNDHAAGVGEGPTTSSSGSATRRPSRPGEEYPQADRCGDLAGHGPARRPARRHAPGQRRPVAGPGRHDRALRRQAAWPAHDGVGIAGAVRGEFGRPSGSPDGRSLAWAEGDGILAGEFGRDCSGTPKLRIPGGREPDWGPAPVNYGRAHDRPVGEAPRRRQRRPRAASEPPSRLGGVHALERPARRDVHLDRPCSVSRERQGGLEGGCGSPVINSRRYPT